MALFDMPLPELESYAPELAEPDDIDVFWQGTLEETRAHPLDLVIEQVDNGLTLVTSYDVTFSGFGGDRIRGWLHVPAGTTGRLAGVVEFHGYSGGRGLAHENVAWALAGHAQLTVDTRGQGWGWRTNATADPSPHAGLTAGQGTMTSGILDPSTYYYRRVFADAVRAIDAMAQVPLVDPERIVVTGISQGGGIAIAASALTDHRLLGAMIDVPFLCHFERALAITDADPYNEIVRYLKRDRAAADRALATLRYFDGAILARRATTPTLFSVALMDPICPPSTVYAAFNRWGGESKQIVVYPFNGHEGGAEFHQAEKYRWLERMLSAG